MEEIILNKIELEKTTFGTKAIYKFDAPAKFKKFLRNDEPLFVEYPTDLLECPIGVLTIPFAGIISTVAMILQCSIYVPALDRTFFESLPEIEAVYRKIYHCSQIEIKVNAGELEEFTYPSSGTVSQFFTGGVDATSAFVAISERKPQLINIWGGDIWISDEDSHASLEAYLDRFSTDNGVSYYFIKTNAREIFKEDELGLECEKILGHRYNHGWWASIAHILSMTSSIAPWMWLNRIAEHHIGSSYDVKKQTFDANNEQLVNAIKYCSCRFHLVDNDVERNAKVKKIVDYCKARDTSVQLKVCWQRVAGCNCSACEKCYRTIMNLIVNHADPNQYGFEVDENTIKEIRSFLRTRTVNAAFWKDIQQAFKKDAKYWRHSELAWMLKIKINSIYAYLNRIVQLICKRIDIRY